MHIIAFLIFGLIVGLIARAIMPGRQSMGWLATSVLGMIGSLIGGFIHRAMFGGPDLANGWGLTPGGLISSIVGAILVLFAYHALGGRTRRTV